MRLALALREEGIPKECREKEGVAPGRYVYVDVPTRLPTPVRRS